MTVEAKKPSRTSAILRILVIWVIQVIAMIIMALLLDGVHIESVGVAFVSTAVVGLLNALLWPILSYVLVPFAIFTLGFAALLINGFMVWLTAEIVEGFTVDGFWTAFWLALGTSAINIILSTLLTIDDDSSWYRNQVKRRMRRIAKPEPTDVPGVLFLEIDGLARPILEKVLREGHMPKLQRWLDSGSHVLTSWETDNSSQTSASQAGILHGDNSNIHTLLIRITPRAHYCFSSGMWSWNGASFVGRARITFSQLDRHHRGGIYPFIRAAMTVLMRELNIYTLIGDMFAGRKSAYATFVGYDEIAHHSGILDPGAFDILFKLDQQFARLESAIQDAPRPYHLVILSDHGQTGGATFLQRYGLSLEEFVQELMTEEIRVGGDVRTEEGYSNLSLFLTDTIENENSGASKVVGRAYNGSSVDGEVVIRPAREEPRKRVEEKDEEEKAPEVIALASGNLGLVAFTQWSHRMTLEEIEAAFPAVIPELRGHEGIGFIMVRSERHGPVVMGAHGTYNLEDDRIEGENPLSIFGPNAPSHLRRTASFPSCMDILVNSFYDPENNEGCAFEELIGFHGGLGGTQTVPFLLHPAEMPVNEELIGAASVYKACKGWLDQIQNGRESEMSEFEQS
ncbi:MAG: hypothetical protein GTO18_10410 [Anaerolineales bacterium]|nr:hypothetical protein [Anaerolineales bacterium]